MRGKLFILSGPTGVGKGTVLSKAFEKLDGIVYSVSCTTRAPRPGEEEGVNYIFTGEDSFKKFVEDGEFLEWAYVHGHCYGTRKDMVENALEEGEDVLLEIDVQGALQVKEKMPDAVMIFIRPPSYEELVRRLKKRGTETPAQLELRIRNAKREMEYSDRYEHVILNDSVSKAADELIKIIKKYREGYL